MQMFNTTMMFSGTKFGDYCFLISNQKLTAQMSIKSTENVFTTNYGQRTIGTTSISPAKTNEV